MKTNLRERSTSYQCVIRPKGHFAPVFSFNLFNPKWGALMLFDNHLHNKHEMGQFKA